MKVYVKCAKLCIVNFIYAFCIGQFKCAGFIKIKWCVYENDFWTIKISGKTMYGLCNLFVSVNWNYITGAN